MGEASGFKRTTGPQSGQWFLNAYYYSFSETGVDLIDEILSATAYAGKRYHMTDQWGEPTENEDGTEGPSSAEEIQMAANRAAEAISAKDAEIARLRKAIVWATDGEVRAETDGKRFFLMGPDIKGRVYFDGSEDDQIATVCRLAGGE